MPSLPIYQVDVFTDAPFAGNPAAVVPLAAWLPVEVMHAVAAENNLSESAFFVEEPDEFAITWFTPTGEIDFCGHATLAAAWVIFNRLRPELGRVRFGTRNVGPLFVERLDAGVLELDLPALTAQPVAASAELLAALDGAEPESVLRADRFIVVYRDEADIRALTPDMAALARIGVDVCVTAPGGGEVDFVSRSFAPTVGIPEDPVTGSDQSFLIPYWTERLGRRDLSARQLSARGGSLRGRLDGGRVRLQGGAALYLEGTIHV